MVATKDTASGDRYRERSSFAERFGGRFATARSCRSRLLDCSVKQDLATSSGAKIFCKVGFSKRGVYLRPRLAEPALQSTIPSPLHRPSIWLSISRRRFTSLVRADSSNGFPALRPLHGSFAASHAGHFSQLIRVVLVRLVDAHRRKILAIGCGFVDTQSSTVTPPVRSKTPILVSSIEMSRPTYCFIALIPF